jgi:hypothetical protein
MAAKGTPPPATSKAEMQALLESSGPVGDERVVDYNIFLTDAFNDRATVMTKGVLDGAGVPATIDGFRNDDSYRQSRHLLLNSDPASRGTVRGEENLRENSLARQLAEKTDQPATIRLIRRRKPEELDDIPAGEVRMPWVNLIPPNTKFFLEQVNEAREEKVQVIDTFGEWVAFFFGRKPEVYSYSGTLLNAKNHDWKNEFQFNYDNYLRGSQAVKHRATMVLQYDDVMVEGYMMNCVISQSAMADKSVPFQFTLLVINRSSMNPLQALALRFQRQDATELEQQLFNTLSAALDAGVTAGGVDAAETFLLMREYFSGNYIPPAGKVSVREGTKMETAASVQPGASSGTTNVKRPRSPFFSDTADAVRESETDIGLGPGALDL